MGGDVCRYQRERAGLPGATRFSELVALFEQDHLPETAKGTQDAYRDSLKPIRAFFSGPCLHALYGVALPPFHGAPPTRTWRAAQRDPYALVRLVTVPPPLLSPRPKSGTG